MRTRWLIVEAIFWKLWPYLFLVTASLFANGSNFAALKRAVKSPVFLNWLIAVQIVLSTICHLSHMTLSSHHFLIVFWGLSYRVVTTDMFFFHFWNKNWRPKGLLKYGGAPSAWGGGRDISPFTLNDNFGYLETVIVHLVMRHIFSNTVQLNWTPEYLVKFV